MYSNIKERKKAREEGELKENWNELDQILYLKYNQQ